MIGIDRFSMNNMVTTPSLPPFQLIACDDHILLGFDDGQRNIKRRRIESFHFESFEIGAQDAPE
jgi:hypothetical protein